MNDELLSKYLAVLTDFNYSITGQMQEHIKNSNSYILTGTIE